MLNDPKVSRRAVLLGMAGMLPAISAARAVAPGISPVSFAGDGAFCPAPRRVAVMAPWIAETMLAMGVEPIAIPEARRDRRAGGLTLSDAVADLGFMGEPNLETLARLRPDLILIDGKLQGDGWRRLMSGIAPVMMLDLFMEARNPWRTTGEHAFAIAEAIGCPGTAERLLAEGAALVERAKLAIAGGDAARHPWFVARMNDARNFTLFCKGSVLHDVLGLLGLRNASPAENDWGFLAAGIDRLAARPEAGLVLIDSPPPGSEQGMGPRSLWRRLPAVREGRVHILDDLYMFGAIPTGMNFARQLAASLTGKPLA